jgi:hypothetical protein
MLAFCGFTLACANEIAFDPLVARVLPEGLVLKECQHVSA